MNKKLYYWLNNLEGEDFESRGRESCIEPDKIQDKSIELEVSNNSKSRYILIIIPASSIYSPLSNKKGFEKILLIFKSLGLNEYITLKIDSINPSICIYFSLKNLFSSTTIGMVVEQNLVQNNYLLGTSILRIFPSSFESLPVEYFSYQAPFQEKVQTTILNWRMNPIKCNTIAQAEKLFTRFIEQNTNEAFNPVTAIRQLKNSGQDKLSKRELINTERIIKKSDLWLATRIYNMKRKWGIQYISDIVNNFAEYAISIERIEGEELVAWLTNSIFSSPNYTSSLEKGQVSKENVEKHILAYYEKYNQNKLKWIYRINERFDLRSLSLSRNNISRKEIIAVIKSIMAKNTEPKKVNQLIALINQEIRDQLNGQNITKYELMKIKEYWHPSFYKPFENNTSQ